MRRAQLAVLCAVPNIKYFLTLLCVLSISADNAIDLTNGPFTAGQCELCTDSQYLQLNENKGQYYCAQCANNSFTNEADPSKLLSIVDCKCNQGYYETTAEADCAACAQGTYKSTDLDDNACSLCSAFSAFMTTAEEASTARTDCLCNAGYYKDDSKADHCSECAAGKVKEDIGNPSTDCVTCETDGTNHYYCPIGSSAMTACPVNSQAGSGSTQLSDCHCDAGFYTVDTFSGVTELSTDNHLRVHWKFDNQSEIFMNSATNTIPITVTQNEVHKTNHHYNAQYESRISTDMYKHGQGAFYSQNRLSLYGHVITPSNWLAENFNEPKQVTFAFWVRTEPRGDGNKMGYYHIFRQTNAFMLREYQSRVRVFFWPEVTSVEQSLWPLETWVHTLIAIDLSSTSNRVQMYINGQLVASDLNGLTDSAFKSSESVFHLFSDSSYSNNDAGFSGYLDDFRIYDKAFTQDEVDELYGIYVLISRVCQPCAAGTYQDATNAPNCKNCPAGTYNELEEQSNSDACLNCDTTGNSRADSAAGSNEFSDCFCKAGHEHDSGSESTSDLDTIGDVCLPCAVGKYRSSDMVFDPATTDDFQYLCENCTLNTYNVYTASIAETACTDCPANSHTTDGATGQDEASDCHCQVGYKQTSEGTLTQVPTCIQCTAGKYSTTPDANSCTDCEAGKASATLGATSENTCLECSAGKISASDGAVACTDCGNDQYQVHTGQSICTDCPGPTGHDSTGQDELADCKCNKGYTGGASAGTCVQCEAGTYKDLDHSNDDCTACTSVHANSHSPVQSDHLNDCFCNAGYYATPTAEGLHNDASHLGLNNACVQCPAGEYCGPAVNDAGTGLLGRQACRGNSNSPVQSSHFTDCKCNAGFYFDTDAYDANERTACSLCRTDDSNEGYYCPANDDEARPCGANTASHSSHDGADGTAQNADGSIKLAASEFQDCVCLAGYWRNCIKDTSEGAGPEDGIAHVLKADGDILNPPQTTACTRDQTYFESDCSACPSHTACEQEEQMQHCPLNSESAVGSDDPHDCECKPGYKKVLLTGVLETTASTNENSEQVSAVSAPTANSYPHPLSTKSGYSRITTFASAGEDGIQHCALHPNEHYMPTDFTSPESDHPYDCQTLEWYDAITNILTQYVDGDASKKSACETLAQKYHEGTATKDEVEAVLTKHACPMYPAIATGKGDDFMTTADGTLTWYFENYPELWAAHGPAHIFSDSTWFFIRLNVTCFTTIVENMDTNEMSLATVVMWPLISATNHGMGEVRILQTSTVDGNWGKKCWFDGTALPSGNNYKIHIMNPDSNSASNI